MLCDPLFVFCVSQKPGSFMERASCVNSAGGGTRARSSASAQSEPSRAVTTHPDINVPALDETMWLRLL